MSAEGASPRPPLPPPSAVEEGMAERPSEASPLLASLSAQARSRSFSDQAAETRSQRRRDMLIRLGLTGLLLFAAIAVFCFTFNRFHEPFGATPKRNVILMISDGFGPASETFARSYHQYVYGMADNYTTPLDDILVGASRTRSSSSLVTDSAAGATAFSCLMKTYNNAVAVDSAHRPCATVLEAAKAKGLLTALVVTSRITHATPAAFSAHVPWRSMEEAIAQQQIGDNPLGRAVDLMFGGGRCFFLPAKMPNSCRTDQRDLFKEARTQYGWSAIHSRAEFDQLDPQQVQLPLHGLFADSHMAYEMDRDATREPSLHEMAATALNIMHAATADQQDGFFMMIEGSRIDMAAHGNDPAAHVHDISEYHRTVAAVRAFVDAHPDTVMISVSDHETGGFTLGRQAGPEYPAYRWRPDVVQAARNSTEALARALKAYTGGKRGAYVREQILANGLGLRDVDQTIMQRLQQATDEVEMANLLARAISDRAELGWTTHGHTGVDVNLYAHGAQAHALRGNHENTDIGHFIANFLGLDLIPLTTHLINAGPFMPPMDERHKDAPPTALSALDRQEWYHHNM